MASDLHCSRSLQAGLNARYIAQAFPPCRVEWRGTVLARDRPAAPAGGARCGMLAATPRHQLVTSEIAKLSRDLGSGRGAAGLRPRAVVKTCCSIVSNAEHIRIRAHGRARAQSPQIAQSPGSTIRNPRPVETLASETPTGHGHRWACARRGLESAPPPRCPTWLEVTRLGVCGWGGGFCGSRMQSCPRRARIERGTCRDGTLFGLADTDRLHGTQVCRHCTRP
jgi:hypothetical protein